PVTLSVTVNAPESARNSRSTAGTTLLSASRAIAVIVTPSASSIASDFNVDGPASRVIESTTTGAGVFGSPGVPPPPGFWNASSPLQDATSATNSTAASLVFGPHVMLDSRPCLSTGSGAFMLWILGGIPNENKYA